MPAATGPSSLAKRLHDHRGMIFPLACVGLLLVLLVPLTPGMLDLLLILNLTLSVIVLVTTIYVKSPRELSVFPSLLLSITLFRLVLNVATTRLILAGDGSGSSAGQVVQAFSQFVTSDSLTVGAVIFLIVFVIQFVVITKGGSRISEVAARFVLDAMPGKQMAIDADVNAGLITRQQAHERREAVAREADFYSAMDGAGRFVRGDAIACVVITMINIIGGLYVGIAQHHLDPAQCLDAYTRLTIGDGLVSQVPAFIVSLAAGLIVSRSSGQSDLGEDVIGQMLAKPQALLVAAAFLAVLAMLGMPKLPLLVLGGACVALAWWLVSRKPGDAALESSDDAPEPSSRGIERLLEVDILELEIGAGLVRMVDAGQGGDLLARVAQIREQIAIELGIIIPAVGIRDSDRIGINDYALKLRGQIIARGAAYGEQFLAIDGGDATGAIPGGHETTEPARGRLAFWITESQRHEAEQLGYGVIEAPQAITSHLVEVLRTHAHELLTRQSVKNLLDNLRTRAAAVVEEVIPHQIKPGELQRVLQNLLREQVPVRDLETILETLGDHAANTHDLDELTQHVRIALARPICRQWADEQDRLPCLLLDGELEELIASHIESGGGAGAEADIMPPAMQQQIAQMIAERATGLAHDGRPPVVLCAAAIRFAVHRLIEPSAPRIAVLSMSEIVPDVAPLVLAVIAAPGAGQEIESQITGGETPDGDEMGEPAPAGEESPELASRLARDGGLIEDAYESSNV